MAFEIQMLSVGCADAIILRYISSENQEIVILIDAGNRADSKKIVDNINQYTNQKYIDLAICTHPDNDHIGGFFYVVEHMQINEFWIHDPAKHQIEVLGLRTLFHANDTIEKALKYVTESLDNSDNLIALIDAKKIRRDREPFAGLEYELAPIKVVGPTEEYYETLLSRFRDVEDWLNEENLLEKSFKGGEMINEVLSAKQLLNRSNERSKENNSSSILLFTPDNLKYLFTSDAGPIALKKAHEYADLSDLDWLDVPHHGSRYNLTSDLIDIFKPKVSYISCDGSKNFPSSAVISELQRVGSKVFTTFHTANPLRRNGVALRTGYSKAMPLFDQSK